MNVEFVFAKSFVSIEILEQEWELYQEQKIKITFCEYLASKNKILPTAKTIIENAMSVRNLQFMQDNELINMYQNYIEYIQKQISAKQNYNDFKEWLYQQNLLNIGRYRIVDKLGKGGFGKVYKAYDPELDKYVAIKILLELDNWERFKREMKICANLEHPNIAPVFDCGEHNSIPYMVMKFVAGETLSNRIAKGMSEKEIKIIMGKIAIAIAAAHEKNIIHRDLKPSNIIIDEYNEPIILDFGIAQVMNQERITKTNEIIGSIYYMAPETFDRSEANKASDVYSLGVILYEMLTKKTPYQAANTSALIYEIISKEASFSNFQNISKLMQEICLKAMNKEIHKRFSSAKELAEILCKKNEKEFSEIQHRKNVSEIKTTKVFSKTPPRKFQQAKAMLNKKWLLITICTLLFVFASTFFLFTPSSIKTHSFLFYYDNELVATDLRFISIQKNLTLDIPQNTFFYLFDKDTKLDNYFLDRIQQQRKISIPLKQFRKDTYWYFICLNRQLTTEEINTIFQKMNQRGIGDIDKYYSSKRQIEDSYALYFSEISSNFAIKPKNKFLISQSPFVIEPLIKSVGSSKFIPLKKDNIVNEGDLLKIKIEIIFPNHHLLIFFRDSSNQLFPLFPRSKEIKNTESYETYQPLKKILYIPGEEAEMEGFPFDSSTGKEHIIAVYSKDSIDIDKVKVWIKENDLDEYIKKSSERGVDFGSYYKQIQKPELPIDIFEVDHQ